MPERLFGLDDASRNQLRYEGLIGGHLLDISSANKISAAVAHLGNEDVIALDEGSRYGRGHLFLFLAGIRFVQFPYSVVRLFNCGYEPGVWRCIFG